MAKVQILETRPLQCFRCLGGGHVKATCTGVDRSARCGDSGQDCSAKPCCPVCTDLGRPAGHRAGDKACPSAHKRERRRGGGPFRIPPPPKATGGPRGYLYIRRGRRFAVWCEGYINRIGGGRWDGRYKNRRGHDLYRGRSLAVKSPVGKVGRDHISPRVRL